MDNKQIEEIGNIHHWDMVAMGWSNPKLSDSHYKMLIIGEVCEAIQAHRRGFIESRVPLSEVQREIIEQSMESSGDEIYLNMFENIFKDTTLDEMADTFLRLLSLAWMRGYKVDELRYTPPITERSIFTETAMGFVKSLLNAPSDREAVVIGVRYIIKWCEVFHYDLYKACLRKMRYNRIRHDWQNKEKRY